MTLEDWTLGPFLIVFVLFGSSLRLVLDLTSVWVRWCLLCVCDPVCE